MDLTVLSSTNESHLNQFTGLDFETLVDLQKFQGLLHANQKGVPTAPPAQRVPQATQQFSRENSHPDFNDSLSMFDNDSMSDGSDICDRDGRQYFDRQVQKIQKPLISKPDLEVDDGETLGLSKEETDKMLPVALINNYYNYNGMYNILLNDQDQEAVKQDQQHSRLNQHSDSESSDEGIDMCSPSSNCTTGTDSPSPMSDDGASTQQVIPTTQAPGRQKRGRKPPAKYTGNGPIQLFQFLLILLLDAKYNNEIIKWTHDKKYEFKLLKPNLIATMWGKRKNKPKMNYEKLSRGLRYYYDKHIIDKVPGKRYVYQFVCDIDKILGYDPTEQKPEGNVEDAVCGEAEAAAESHEFITDHSPETSVDSAVTDWDFTAFFN